MKRLILLACCTFILAEASAQDTGKSFFVTASAGGSYHKENQFSKSTSLQLSTSINYLLKERWALGLAAENTRGTIETGQKSAPINSGTGYTNFYSAAETKLKTWFLGPQVRYYHPLTSKLSAFGEAQAGLYFQAAETKSNSESYYYSPGGYSNPSGTPTAKSYSDSKNEALSVRAVTSLGLVYFLKPRFGLELKTSVLYYNHGLDDSRLPDGAEQAKNLDFDLSLANSRFGASFYF
ncbi:hypothetical protein [Pontibacter cellulosilyticus]|uniref:Outer membrane protein beta-barrel domain-containing protein n=1 Tax=Pontibacter cellulosilyticus TaxID=1720253 RepID=A0A923SJ96_9BACT|nr:hypothetical protein [Pontibacter cellulosilyticus]MBC5993427.1 hypothetical protein [Pontibacter cellulosilyticus]